MAGPEQDEMDRLEAVRMIHPSCFGPTSELKALAELGQKIFSVKRAAIHVLDEDWLRIATQAGMMLAECTREITICDRVVMNRQVLVVPDMRDVPELAEMPYVEGEPFLRFYAGAPVELERGLIVGTFCLLDDEPRPVETVDVDSLVRFATVASALLKLQRNNFQMTLAEQHLRLAALTDPLTRFYNRGALPVLVDPLLQAASIGRTELGVLYLDMDGFKTINDTFGHDVGDAVLQQAADRIRAVLGQNGIVVRMGGDEFAIFIERVADSAFLSGLADRLVKAFHPPFTVKDKQLQARLSVGGALAGVGRFDRGTLLQIVDTALYQAKAAGRNRAIIQAA
ncbi:diguanylate cyclase domain-containing protein [Rhizobium helianthi]|uniref:Diguanylate cyclase domain-containing protein n=1 Tax=Rhizobium helianthi TaxID=1132695 RepID=A0ABW4M6S4_9HYPH